MKWKIKVHIKKKDKQERYKRHRWMEGKIPTFFAHVFSLYIDFFVCFCFMKCHHAQKMFVLVLLSYLSAALRRSDGRGCCGCVIVGCFLLPLGFSDGLERRAGRGTSVWLSSSCRLSRAQERPLLGILLIVQALDPIEVLVYLHLLHLALGWAAVGAVGVRGCSRGRGDMQDSPVPRLRQGTADVHSVRRQGSRVCGQATCDQLSTADQLRTVDLEEKRKAVLYANARWNEPFVVRKEVLTPSLQPFVWFCF